MGHRHVLRPNALFASDGFCSGRGLRSAIISLSRIISQIQHHPSPAARTVRTDYDRAEFRDPLSGKPVSTRAWVGAREERPAKMGLMTVTVRRRMIAKTPELRLCLLPHQ